MEETETSSKGKKKTTLIIAVLIAAVAIAAYLIPAMEKENFQNETQANFSSLKDSGMDVDDLSDIQDQYDKAEAVLNRDAYNLDANLTKAGVLYRTQEYEKAIMVYKKLEELYSSDSRSFKGLGDVYFKQQKYPDAENAYWAALKADSQNVDAYLQIAKIYRYTSEESKNKDKVKKFYEDGIQALTDNDKKSQMIDAYADSLERIGDYEKAVEELNALLANSPDDQDLKDKITALQAKQAAATAAQPVAVPAQ